MQGQKRDKNLKKKRTLNIKAEIYAQALSGREGGEKLLWLYLVCCAF